MTSILLAFEGSYGTQIDNDGDILVRGVTSSRANYVGAENIYFPASVLQDIGTNAYLLVQKFHGPRFGFMADANWDQDVGAWVVNKIVKVYDEFNALSDQKRTQMIAILRERRTLPGETRLTLSEVDDIIALLTAPPLSVDGNRPSTGDFRCHHCKHVVKDVVAAPDRCPVCRCRDFSACAPSCSHAA